MSPATLLWLKAFHLFGVFLWLGTMSGLANILVAHGKADLGSRPAFHKLERLSGIMMDLGATIGIATGVVIVLKVPGLMKAGYMHAKLGLVVLVLLAAHGFLRLKIRKFREGKVVPVPGFVPPLLTLTGLAILILVVVKPF